MSVAAIQLSSQPSLSETLTGGAQIAVQLEAKCTETTDGVLAVRAHAGCPKKGDAYSFGGESDASFVCIGVNIAPKADSFGIQASKVYSIEATYSNSVNTGSLGDDEENPLDDPPVVRFNRSTYQAPATVDIDGNAVTTGADEAFDPPFMKDQHRTVLNIIRNEASFSAAAAFQLEDVVNNDAFGGMPAGHAKMRPPIAEKLTRGSYTYWRVEYEIEFNRVPWNPTGLLAQGYRYRPAVGEQAQNYIDPATGQPPASPILLNLDGTKADDPLGDGALPVFHEFTFYEEIPFGPFGFGV